MWRNVCPSAYSLFASRRRRLATPRLSPPGCRLGTTHGSSRVLLLALVASPAVAAPPMHPTKEASVVSTARAEYVIVQEDQEVGRESVTRRIFDDNTIHFDAENTIRNVAVTLTIKSRLTIEEESYFPRAYRADKTITQPDKEMEHAITVDMYANVAVLGSELSGRKDSRRVVVPAGTAIQEVGLLYPWYQLLFWIDPQTDGRQRIQWLDPSSGKVESGELYVDGEEILDVSGKKTRVTVYKAERERLGPATLYVDERRRIVKAEQNMSVYRLEKWSEETAKK